MRDDPTVVALVTRATAGDQGAWHEIVERYAPLVWSICVRYQLNGQDAEDVGQTVWLLLVEQLGKLREPAALPGWLAATTAHECLRVVKAARRIEDLGGNLDNALLLPDAATIEQEIITAERNARLRAALAALPARCRQLLSMLMSDPPPAYAEIHAALDIPVGSIGPQRARCLDRLRRSKYLIGLGEDEVDSPGGVARA
jgi:RNA polymerase sigma factor (sigma-70 family)